MCGEGLEKSDESTPGDLATNGKAVVREASRVKGTIQRDMINGSERADCREGIKRIYNLSQRRFDEPYRGAGMAEKGNNYDASCRWWGLSSRMCNCKEYGER